MSGMLDNEKEKVNVKIGEAKKKTYSYNTLKAVFIAALIVGAIVGNVIAK